VGRWVDWQVREVYSPTHSPGSSGEPRRQPGYRGKIMTTKHYKFTGRAVLTKVICENILNPKCTKVFLKIYEIIPFSRTEIDV
jgi:hypothetical protein